MKRSELCPSGHLGYVLLRNNKHEGQTKGKGCFAVGGQVWLGLDIGTRRIGVAKSDGLGITAQPYDVVHRQNKKHDLQTIARMAEKEQASGFVVGLPIRTDGSKGPETDYVEQFAAKLGEHTQLPIKWVDERFTTVIAERALKEQGLKAPQRRHRVDQVAAALILQTF